MILETIARLFDQIREGEERQRLPALGRHNLLLSSQPRHLHPQAGLQSRALNLHR